MLHVHLLCIALGWGNQCVLVLVDLFWVDTVEVSLFGRMWHSKSYKSLGSFVVEKSEG
jgi:hypothetical protein